MRAENEAEGKESGYNGQQETDMDSAIWFGLEPAVL
jgi:hypothetical protein